MTGLWITAGLIIAAVIATPFACAAIDRSQDRAWRRETGQDAVRGRHRALKPLPATVPRVTTEHEPPWQPAPAFQAAPVIEPDAVISGPPQPEPDAFIIAAWTVSSGQMRIDRFAVLPPVHSPALPQWVIDSLGADSVDGAVAEIFSVAHSWESNFSKGHVRQVRELLAGES